LTISKRLARLASIISALLLFAAWGRAPRRDRFELPPSWTGSYAEGAARKFAEVANAPAPAADQPEACSLEKDSFYRCFVGSPRGRYVAPFPVAVPYVHRKEPAGWFGLPVHLDLAGAPIQSVKDGKFVYAGLQRDAYSHRLFDCAGPVCSVIVRAFADSAVGRETMLASCLVTVVGGGDGAPYDCGPVAVDGNGRGWIIIVAGYERVLFAPPMTTFDMRVASAKRLTIVSVLRAAKQAIEAKPFLLRTEVYPATVVGEREYAASKILPGWRERVYLRVDAAEGVCQSPRTPVFCTYLKVSIEVYLSRQNTTREIDWHLPEAAQRNAYADSLRESLRLQLGLSCDQPTWIDSRTLGCGVAKDEGYLRDSVVPQYPPLDPTTGKWGR